MAAPLAPLSAASTIVRGPGGRRRASSGGHTLASRSAAAPITAKTAPTANVTSVKIDASCGVVAPFAPGRCVAAPASYAEL
jgi:hypothetical protein